MFYLAYGCLNAPFGARCFLTLDQRKTQRNAGPGVLRRSALGAFCPRPLDFLGRHLLVVS